MKRSRLLMLMLCSGILLQALAQKEPIRLPEQLQSKGTIPRLAWYSIPARETSLQRYQELKEAGITISFSFFSSLKDAEKALEIAQQAGIKIVLSCPELKTAPESTVKKFMRHPAIAGYFLRDEPSRIEFTELGQWAKRIRAIDSTHFCYVNTLPIYAENWQFETPKEQDSLTATTYREYMRSYIKEVPVPFISFDGYCIIGDSIRANYYENLEIVAEESEKVGKRFWAFALTTASSVPVNYPPPTLAELRFQIYSILAYGAQGVQYFTYWTPGPEETIPWDFNQGPIGLDGKRTVVYDRLRQMNEEVRNLSGVFYGGKVVSVRHIGTSVPKGTKRLQKLPPGIKVLDTHGAGALVATIENENQIYVIVVNRDIRKSLQLTLYGDAALKRVLKDGSIVPADLYTSNMEVDPGDAVIYQLPRSANVN